MNEKSNPPIPPLKKGGKGEFSVEKIICCESGIALVITLLVLTLLLTIVLDFNLGMRVEARAAANFRDDMKAYYLARSGTTFAIALLEEDGKTGANYDALNELWAQKVPPIPVGDGFVSVEITDEDGKINVNKLATDFGMMGEDNRNPLIMRLLDHFELKSELADTIADWIDKDDKERYPNGAESAYYESLEDPYEAKNKPLDSLEELRLIKGMDDDIYGKLKNFLTAYSDGKININTASKEVLMALSDDLTGEMADKIIADRVENPFQKIQDLGSSVTFPRESVYGEISRFIDVKSNYFSIVATGQVNQSKKTINAIVKRSGGKSNIVYWRME